MIQSDCFIFAIFAIFEIFVMYIFQLQYKQSLNDQTMHSDDSLVHCTQSKAKPEKYCLVLLDVVFGWYCELLGIAWSCFWFGVVLVLGIVYCLVLLGIVLGIVFGLVLCIVWYCLVLCLVWFLVWFLGIVNCLVLCLVWYLCNHHTNDNLFVEAWRGW